MAELFDGLVATSQNRWPSLRFDAMAATTGLPLVSRFAQGIAVAVERGTPLADVLHAQAADVREAGIEMDNQTMEDLAAQSEETSNETIDPDENTRG